MPRTINFTKAALDALKSEAKQYDLIDTKTPGLRLRVNSGGSKTYNLIRKVRGRMQRIKIGSYADLSIEQARKQAFQYNGQIAAGSDPQADKNALREEPTFLELYEIYYEQHAKIFNKRPEDNRKMLEVHILPRWGAKRAGAITPEMVRLRHQKIGSKSGRRKGKGIANRVMTIVSAVYNFTIKHGYFKGANPCLGLSKFRIASRDRFLSSEELDSFFEALKPESQKLRDFFRMLLFTGARKSNVLSMRFEDINLDLRRWRIGEAETKNRDVNVVMLSAPAIKILERRKRGNGKRKVPSQFVFPGKGKQGWLNDPKRAFERVRQRMGVSDIRIHDLRRTMGSYMAIGGSSLPIIGGALGHKSQVSTAIYARLSQNPILDAVDAAASLMTANRQKS